MPEKGRWKSELRHRGRSLARHEHAGQLIQPEKNDGSREMREIGIIGQI